MFVFACREYLSLFIQTWLWFNSFLRFKRWKFMSFSRVLFLTTQMAKTKTLNHDFIWLLFLTCVINKILLVCNSYIFEKDIIDGVVAQKTEVSCLFINIWTKKHKQTFKVVFSRKDLSWIVVWTGRTTVFHDSRYFFLLILCELLEYLPETR